MSSDVTNALSRAINAAVIGIVIGTLIVILFATGCGPEITPEQKAQIESAEQERHHRYHDIQHTGLVTVVDVSVSYCEPTNGGRSGTAICDRALTLETPGRGVYNMGLCRTGQWPPVWHGMKADIYFRLYDHNGFDETTEHDCAVIEYAQEIK